jgi:hypothetical protein
MRRTAIAGVALLILPLFWLAVAQPAHADAVWGTGLCFEAQSPQFQGYWEYCFHICWDTRDYGGQGLSHSTVYLALSECVCACHPVYFGHRVPAGVGVGEDECELDFYSQFDCDGDPHFPIPGPTMKFEPDELVCQPGTVGEMHVCYYSLFPPTEYQIFGNHLGIKFGQHVETGNLQGVLPYCECEVVPVGQSTWGTIKVLYR